MSRLAQLRARRLLLLYGRAIAIGLLLVSVVALVGAGWVYTHPATTQVTDEIHRQSITSTLSSQAVASANNSLYTPGETLEDQPVYLRASTHTPTLEVRTRVQDAEHVTITQRIELTYRAERDGETFWQNTTTLVQKETTSSSETVRMQTDLDIKGIENRAETLRSTIGSAGLVHVELRFIVSYSTDRYNGTISEPIPLQITDEWYRVGSPTAQRDHGTQVSRTVALPGEDVNTAGLGALGLISLGLGALVGKLSRDESKKLDQSDIEHELHRLRYSEWISPGTLPEDVGETVIAVDSLEALVDVAIDTNTRTIYDADRDCYAIVDGSTVYRYDPS